MSTVASILLWMVYIYLSAWAFYFLLFTVAGRISRSRETPEAEGVRFLVLLPSYKEDAVIVESARTAAEHSYPGMMFDVLVIADTLKPETVEKLRAIPVKVLEVSFEKSTKSKSLNAALASLEEPYDAVVILDADNHIQPGFLAKAAWHIKNGSVAIQGHRMAKNMNTTLAFLDAISEEVNNHIFRKGHRAMGLSSALIGSAMVFSFPLFRNIMSEIDAIGGFDRELELRLIGRGIRIGYAEDACVLDEKVQQQEVFRNQRRRWLSAQYHYFGQYWKKGVVALLSGRIDYADKVLQGIQVPRLLLPGLIVLAGAIATGLSIGPAWTLWTASLCTVVVSLLMATPARFFGIRMIRAAASLPVTFINMLLLLFKLKGANKTFIHTTHGEHRK